MFDRLGRPSFFDEAVEMVTGRMAARMEQATATARRKSLCAFAPQGSGIRGVAEREARKLGKGIARLFVETGVLEPPQSYASEK